MVFGLAAGRVGVDSTDFADAVPMATSGAGEDTGMAGCGDVGGILSTGIVAIEVAVTGTAMFVSLGAGVIDGASGAGVAILFVLFSAGCVMGGTADSWIGAEGGVGTVALTGGLVGAGAYGLGG